MRKLLLASAAILIGVAFSPAPSEAGGHPATSRGAGGGAPQNAGQSHSTQNITGGPNNRTRLPGGVRSRRPGIPRSNAPNAPPAPNNSPTNPQPPTPHHNN